MSRLLHVLLCCALTACPLARASFGGSPGRQDHPSASVGASGTADRAYWVGMLDRLSRPVLTAAAAHELHARMPLEITPANRGAHRELYAHLEAVGRLLVGIAPWLELDSARLPADEARLQGEFRRLSVATIDAITDPRSPDFCNFSEGKQPLVDAAFLAEALLRAPRQLWAPLSTQAKQNVIHALKDTRAVKPSYGNWLMFSAMVEAALDHCSGDNDWDRSRVDFAFREHETYYKGDGTYGDGPEYRWDYYNAFVIQPMLLDVLDALADKGPWVDATYPARIRARAQRYAAVQERLISPEGAFPPVGRSLAYRVGALQVLGLIALRHELPHNVSPAQVRCALTAAIHRSMDAPGTFDPQGWLRIGFCGSQPSIGEGYISTGSLYLCSAVLVPLGLPPTDPFWSGAPADWTSRKIYRGEDVPADHALLEPRPPREAFLPGSR